MQLETWDTISDRVRAQLGRVTEIWKQALGEALVGVYLHGSLVLGAFREGVSDLDLLVVCRERLPREKRLEIVQKIMEADGKPCPLELSAICLSDLHPWRHPVRCQFHYSDFWTARYREMLSGKIGAHFLLDEDFEDPDITCHVKLTRQSGICLYGEAIDTVFPPVPEVDFWQSISADVHDYDFNAYEPRYFASNILILGRVLSYKVEHRILSKYEAGVWTAEHVPEALRPVVLDALDAWYTGREMRETDPALLDALKNYLIDALEN